VPVYSSFAPALNWLAARARPRCASIAASNPASSTVTPRSRQTSAVRSNGKPKESVERECRRAVEHLAAARERLLQHPHAILDRLAEALLLLFQHLRNALGITT
jgi:hypothetical protein